MSTQPIAHQGILTRGQRLPDTHLAAGEAESYGPAGSCFPERWQEWQEWLSVGQPGPGRGDTRASGRSQEGTQASRLIRRLPLRVDAPA